jgi:predicted RNA-binding Zn ribbon-like protein
MVDIQVEERVPLYVSTESPHDRWTNDAPASEMAGTLAVDR